MAPSVKQGAAGGSDPNALLIETGRIHRWWLTPPNSSEARLIRTLRDELADAYEQVRLWERAFWIVSVQFLVVFVAAIWGWTR